MKKQLINILMKGKVTLIGGLVFLAFCPLFLIFENESIAEKFALVAYFLLVFGVTQLFVEFIMEERKGAKKAEK